MISLLEMTIISHDYFDDVYVDFYGTSLEHEGQRATRLFGMMFNDPENAWEGEGMGGEGN